jgi:hypothetical protein
MRSLDDDIAPPAYDRSASAPITSAGLRASDKPYRPALQFADAIAIERALGLGPKGDQPLVREAWLSLVANLIWHAWIEQPCSVFYSRDRNAFVESDATCRDTTACSM